MTNTTCALYSILTPPPPTAPPHPPLPPELRALHEEHAETLTDLESATVALDSYKQTLASAEAKMLADRKKLAALQATLRKGKGARAEHNKGDEPESLEGARHSRVHFLYFLSCFLLLKVSLSAQERTATVAAEEVFDEIIDNKVPLDEWPVCIFARLRAPKTARGDNGGLATIAPAQVHQASHTIK